VQNIVPVTVRQILESREDGLKIGIMDVHMVSKLIKDEVENVWVTYNGGSIIFYVISDC
jgi:hypothetical protein